MTEEAVDAKIYATFLARLPDKQSPSVPEVTYPDEASAAVTQDLELQSVLNSTYKQSHSSADEAESSLRGDEHDEKDGPTSKDENMSVAENREVMSLYFITSRALK